MAVAEAGRDEAGVSAFGNRHRRRNHARFFGGMAIRDVTHINDKYIIHRVNTWVLGMLFRRRAPSKWLSAFIKSHANSVEIAILNGRGQWPSRCEKSHRAMPRNNRAARSLSFAHPVSNSRRPPPNAPISRQCCLPAASLLERERPRARRPGAGDSDACSFSREVMAGGNRLAGAAQQQ